MIAILSLDPIWRIWRIHWRSLNTIGANKTAPPYTAIMDANELAKQQPGKQQQKKRQANSLTKEVLTLQFITHYWQPEITTWVGRSWGPRSLRRRRTGSRRIVKCAARDGQKCRPSNVIRADTHVLLVCSVLIFMDLAQGICTNMVTYRRTRKFNALWQTRQEAFFFCCVRHLCVDN